MTVVTFYANGPLRETLERDGVRVVCANKRSRWDLVGFLWRLVRITKAERPRVLYSFLPTANLVALLVRCFVHVDIVSWGVRASGLDTASYGGLVRAELILAARLAGLANVIICNSSAGLLHHASLGYPDKRMHVIHNGIDTRRFSFEKNARARVRAEWGVLDGEFLIGLVARVDPMKGHELFIRAARALAAELPQARFVCVGAGRQQTVNGLRAFCRELGLAERLIWVDQRLDMPAVYSALDLLSSTSLFGEGFSNSIGEAMACERLCVVTDVGDAREIVSTHGWIVPPSDPGALVAAWTEAADLSAVRRTELGVAARQRIERDFSVARMVDETVSLLGLRAA